MRKRKYTEKDFTFGDVRCGVDSRPIICCFVFQNNQVSANCLRLAYGWSNKELVKLYQTKTGSTDELALDECTRTDYSKVLIFTDLDELIKVAPKTIPIFIYRGEGKWECYENN